MDEKKIGSYLADNFSGPILFDYVWWVLRQVQQRRITTLYFLARDGYILYLIAKMFCEQFSLNIKCRYLYCSRISLRIPTYHMIGEEGDRLLFLNQRKMTPMRFLQKLQLSDYDCGCICEDCGLKYEERNQDLSKKAMNSFQKKLQQSLFFRNCLMKHSKAAYQTAVGYFQQEGIFDQSVVAIVDCGWNGTMQRSFRQLLESAGFKGKISGFYFGMNTRPQQEDGEFTCWYFDSSKGAKRKIFFNQNLFECLLSAPHGMTVSYFLSEKYQPVLKDDRSASQIEVVNEQIENILQYTNQQLHCIDFQKFSEKHALEKAFHKIKRYMIHPTPAEAAYYGQLAFGDDVIDGNKISLAAPEQIVLLKQYVLPVRIWHRFFRWKQDREEQVLFWPYGVIAFLPWWKGVYYRINIYLWEILRHYGHF